MNWQMRRMAWACWGAVLVLSCAVSAQTTKPAAADTDSGKGQVGTVTGNNVYVRSGFSTNYYPVTKLNRGDKVRVVNEEFGWLSIVSPTGTHSLIEKTYVDVLDDKTGVLNDNGVWIRAGSNLDPRRYARQVKLNKGMKVKIIGETKDGAFYKIVPPAGANVWIKADFVDVTGGTERVESPQAPTIAPVKPGALSLKEDLPKLEKSAVTPSLTKKAADVAAKPALTPAEAIGLEPGEKSSIQINAIEAEIAAENTKPLAQRDYTAAIEKLRPMAEQTNDEVGHLYANARIEQLENQMNLIRSVTRLETMKVEATAKSSSYSRERQALLARIAQARGYQDIVARGEIKVSQVYDGSGARLKRWRLVDPAKNRTVAYIEVAKDSPIDPVQYYGKYVGIRAASRKVMRGTIPPLPIYTIQEIVVLDPQSPAETPTPAAARTGGAARTASPESPAIAAPTSQPAGGAQ